MEGHNERGMDPKPGQLKSSSAGMDQLESPSAGTCFETPGQQFRPNWEMGRTTVDGNLLVGVSSNLRGNIFSLKELVTDLPKDKEPASEENKQFDLGGK